MVRVDFHLETILMLIDSESLKNISFWLDKKQINDWIGLVVMFSCSIFQQPFFHVETT